MRAKNDLIQHNGFAKPGETSILSADTSSMISPLIVACLGLFIAISCVVSFTGNDIVSKVVNIYYFKLPDRPYFIPQHAFFFYVLTPAVVLSSLVLWFSPGICLVLSRGKTHSLSETVILAFGTSYIAYFVLTSIAKLIVRQPPDPSVFLAAVSIGAFLALGFLAYRVYTGAKLPWPLKEKTDIRRLIWTIAIPVIVLLLLLPVFFWQDMHDDGIEALEIGRSLASHYLPRFPTPTGFSGLGGGMMPMAYPVHWFVSLFGNFEVSARLPILIYLPVLFCLLIQLIEWNSPRKMGLIQEALLCLALAIYTVTMSYSSSYDPYFADIAAPAAFSTVTIICILATLYFLWTGQTAWFFFFAVTSYLCRPTGLLVLGLLGAAIYICMAEGRRPLLMKLAAAVALCVIITVVFEHVYVPLMVGGKGLGLGSSSILKRLQYLRVDDISRFNYMLFPCGILPVFALLAFRWQDLLARIISIVSIAYFFFFYFMAFVALHHFAPVMILPLVVFWRLYLHHQKRFPSFSLPAVALTGIIAFWLSLPNHFEINRTLRAIGQKTACLFGDYNADYQGQVKHYELLFKFIPPDWEVKDPTRELVSGYGSILYYSTRPKRPDTRINYVFQPLSSPTPEGFTKIADDEVVGIFVKDLEEWHRDRFQPLRTDFASSLYAIPRAKLFRHWGAYQGNYSINLLDFKLIDTLWQAIRSKSK